MSKCQTWINSNNNYCFYKIDVNLSIFHFSKPMDNLQTRVSVQASSYHQHASIRLVSMLMMKENCLTLLAMLFKSLFRFMLRKVQGLRNCSCYLRITWMSVALLMCLALRIAVRNSKGKIWKSIWRMTVQIGPSLAPSALKRFCGTAWRFVVTFDLLSFGFKRPSFNSTLTDM